MYTGNMENIQWIVRDATNGKRLGTVTSKTERGAKNQASRHIPYYNPEFCYVTPAQFSNICSIEEL